MTKIYEIFEDDKKEKLKSDYKVRKSARGIVINENNEILTLYVGRTGIFKLPGGGLENDEDKKEGFVREVLEESGYEIEILDELGQINEHRIKNNQLQINYIFLAKTIKKISKPKFTQNEINDKFELRYKQINELFKNMKNQKPTDYFAQFMLKRDLLILEKYLESLK